MNRSGGDTDGVRITLSSMTNDERSTPLPPIFQWTLPGRAVVFFLAATSIWCLLADFTVFAQ